jgi:nucleotide-binding universal stress UspA family protein
MIKSILVPATGNETDTDAFAAALMVARSFAAHIDALHVRLDPIEFAVATAASDGSGAGGPMLESLIDQLEQDADEREAKTRAGFSEFCAREAVLLAAAPAEAGGEPSAQFHVETGQEARWMAAYGMTADLVVAARGTPGKDAVARSTLEALLLESGRPLLIPGASTRGPGAVERVAIAWKPTPQAVRAVAFAMPFLARAKEIAVLTVEEEGGGRDDAERLVSYLAWHGMKAVAQRLSAGPNGAAETLLATASKSAGLLVMGGYGHTRLREWVFGGFTQRALADAPLSVLIAH